ncbi:MAG: rhomboid family intramembrane serine protease [Anaerolineae bacterium]
MIPISDNQPRRRTPIVTYLLIGLNMYLFLVQLSQGPAMEAFVYRWGVVPARLAQWAQHPVVLITLVTSMFLHGGWLHLLGNMLYLWIFGDNVEDRLGHGRFLLFYLAGGVAAGLVQAFFTAGSPLPAIGASGAVAAVLGAYMVLYPAARVHVLIPLFFWFTTVSVPAVFALGLWFISQFFNGLFSLGMTAAYAGGVAWWAHVGGFIMGAYVAGKLPKRPSRPRHIIIYNNYNYDNDFLWP